MCAIFFTAYTVLNWHVSERPLTHLLTLEVFLEVFTLPSLFLCTGERWLNFNFLFAFFILSKFVRFDEEIVLFRQKPLVLRLSMRLALRFFAFLFIASCGIQLLELIGDSTRSDSEVYELTWVNAFYFAVITLMTVGYGDFVAYTILGRLWVVVNALLAAYLVTRSIGLLVDNLARRPRGESSLLMFGDSDHVILCGSVKWEQLLQFVKEFYRGSDNYFTKVVVLCPDGPWSDEKWRKQVSRNETFRNNVVYIDGSVYEDRDMERSRADCARAFFVFATLREKDDSREDSNNLKRILAIREYSSNVPIYALNAHPESSFQFRFAMQPTNTDEEDDFNMRRSTLSILGRSRSSIFGQRSSQPSIWGLDGQRARRSTSMCLREVEMTLFTENIFCNGFSSLVTNLVCHSESSVSINDKPWMVEYKIGAACRLQSAQLPAGLWGRTTGEIAMSLYDCGLILLAVRSAETWKILEPSMTIPKRSTGMFISYLSGESLVKAVDCTSGFWGASDGSGSSSSDNLFSSSSEDDSSTTANSISTTISFGGFQSDGESHSSGEAGMKKRRSSFDSLILRKVLHSDSHRNSGPSTPRSRAPERKDRGLEPRSRHIGFDLSKGLSLAGVNKRADNSKKGRKLKVHSRFEELPVRLKEHILICFNESRGLGTLELLLGRIWTLAKRRGSGKVPVVVINEHFPPKFESRFARHSRDLFLVRGNGQSLDSLRQAQLQKAMAVIISSPDVNPGDLDSAADSSVMFTIMTLDFLLGENSDTFVCGFIGSEESMEVFPAPNHARRRRKALGLKTDSAAVPVDAQSGEPGSQVGGRSSLALHRTSSVPERMDRASAPLIMQSMTLPNLRALFAPPEGDEASPLRLGLPPRNRERFLDLSEFLSESDEEEHFERRDFRAKTGVKEEGVERQRYASGELMIPWLASAAIVREFNEPGFAKLLEDLIGCGQKDSSWIQLVRVAPNCAGRTYRAVMETLLAHGVIAIGLYRCVDAPVRLNDSQELSVSGSSRASARRSDGLNLSLGETAYLLAGSPMISNETCYTCPTTKGKYFFHTPVGGENKLPYVYTNPQPFTLVSDRDAVYCIANPSIDLPDEW
ncbi:hypothetical protein NDN08_003804 [Rhodosorus marinus]|uniref:Potassium channel domain-containing protein n=1 Tax=Rhodosorus marinus TaxID=101924 RepID=A0AAV8UGH8_9RHOD|nr:hypothetical protein NDN08_003804 [Rhodosorus marinus]